jgi:Type ISP C-terminal specificity domain
MCPNESTIHLCTPLPRWGREVKFVFDPNKRAFRLPGKKPVSTPLCIKLVTPDTRDIYLNDRAYWKNVPARVWEYTLGGYQVLKKWLSYREKAILGRGLTIDEVAYLQQVARRIAALLLLGPELNENYCRVKANAYPWKREG